MQQKWTSLELFKTFFWCCLVFCCFFCSPFNFIKASKASTTQHFDPKPNIFEAFVWAEMPNDPIRVIVGEPQSDIAIIIRITFMVHPVPDCWRGIVIMAHDGLCGVTSGSPLYAGTQLTATLGQLTLFDGSPVRVAGLARACARVCVCVWWGKREREREDVCFCVPPPESLHGRMAYRMAR